MTNAGNNARLAITSLLAERGPGKTICPSEAARRLAGDGGNWRDLMPLINEAADALADSGAIRISWKGRELDRRSGPYRIGPS